MVIDIHLGGLNRKPSKLYKYKGGVLYLDSTYYGYTAISTTDKYSVVDIDEEHKVLFINLRYLSTAILVDKYGHGIMPCYIPGMSYWVDYDLPNPDMKATKVEDLSDNFELLETVIQALEKVLWNGGYELSKEEVRESLEEELSTLRGLL